MSWDVSLYNFSRKYASFAEIPNSETPSPLGTLSEVHVAVSRAFPGTSWEEPTWGIFDSPFGSIEFNAGSAEPVQSICMHVRAESPIVNLILRLCAQTGWQAMDLSDGRVLEESNEPEVGLEKWRSYLNHVLGKREA